VQFVRPRCLVKIYYSAGRAPLSGRSRPIGPLSRKSSVCFSNVANETSLGAGFMTARGVAAAFSVTFAPLNPVIAKPQAPPPRDAERDEEVTKGGIARRMHRGNEISGCRSKRCLLSSKSGEGQKVYVMSKLTVGLLSPSRSPDRIGIKPRDQSSRRLPIINLVTLSRDRDRHRDPSMGSMDNASPMRRLVLVGEFIRRSPPPLSLSLSRSL